MRISNQAKLREGESATVTGISPALVKDLVANLKEQGADTPNSEHLKVIGHFRSKDSTTLPWGAQTHPWPALPPTGIPSPSGELAKVPGSTQHTARTFTSGVASSSTLQELAPNTNKESAAGKGSVCQQHTVCRV